jgi:predicted aldo/keto reductase-like oxidoreductase
VCQTWDKYCGQFLGLEYQMNSYVRTKNPLFRKKELEQHIKGLSISIEGLERDIIDIRDVTDINNIIDNNNNKIIFPMCFNKVGNNRVCITYYFRYFFNKISIYFKSMQINGLYK